MYQLLKTHTDTRNKRLWNMKKKLSIVTVKDRWKNEPIFINRAFFFVYLHSLYPRGLSRTWGSRPRGARRTSPARAINHLLGPHLIPHYLIHFPNFGILLCEIYPNDWQHSIVRQIASVFLLLLPGAPCIASLLPERRSQVGMRNRELLWLVDTM